MPYLFLLLAMFHENDALLGAYDKNYHRLYNPNIINAHLEGPLGVRFPSLIGEPIKSWAIAFWGQCPKPRFPAASRFGRQKAAAAVQTHRESSRTKAAKQ